ncbi:hypothetical protein ACGK9R_15320 [Halomonas sp. HNIBRBA4712]|uniref:hypothetical protein n=1 Tax=Halomonas sp. HNIBRBA4712 TaxID=3373087 RepID=UPI0037475B76
MQGIDRGFANAWRELEAGMQQAMYYALLSDIFMFIAISVFVGCCCVIAVNFKRYVNESSKVKRVEKQYYSIRAERERLEAKKLELELGLVDEINKLVS